MTSIDALNHSDEITLVILDVGLPGGISGFDGCRKIRRSSNVPIIFLTARGYEIDQVVGLEIGAALSFIALAVVMISTRNIDWNTEALAVNGLAKQPLTDQVSS